MIVTTPIKRRPAHIIVNYNLSTPRYRAYRKSARVGEKIQDFFLIGAFTNPFADGRYVQKQSHILRTVWAYVKSQSAFLNQKGFDRDVAILLIVSTPTM